MMAFLMGLKSVSPGEVHELVEKRMVTVVDVNSRQSWDRAHVPAARRAKAMGYGNVMVMSAGISGWLAEQLPVEAGA